MGRVSPVRLGVVGAGGIAAAYAQLLTGSGGDGVAVGVVDVRAEAAAAWAERVGCPALPDVDALVAARPDAVVLCTPPATHAPLAAKFLAHGIAVLCEKPLAIDERSALTMHDAARRSRTPLGMAAKFRFCTDLIRAKALMEDGSIGTVRLVENAFTSRIDMGPRWNSRRELSGGGVIIDNGTHSVDLVAWLVGPITSVFATEQSRPGHLDVEDTARLQLVTEPGVDASVDLSWSIDKSLSDFLRVYGTDGELRVGWRESAWRGHGGDWVVYGTGYDKLEAMGGALWQFCRAVRGEEPLAVGSRDGVRSAAVIDAAYASLSSGSWVKVEPLWTE